MLLKKRIILNNNIYNCYKTLECFFSNCKSLIYRSREALNLLVELNMYIILLHVNIGYLFWSVFTNYTSTEQDEKIGNGRSEWRNRNNGRGFRKEGMIQEERKRIQEGGDETGRTEEDTRRRNKWMSEQNVVNDETKNEFEKTGKMWWGNRKEYIGKG